MDFLRGGPPAPPLDHQLYDVLPAPLRRPRGGGAVVGDSRALLAESAYHYGTFFDLFGVGEEYKPFPILDGSDPGEGFVRFTAKMLERSELGQAHADAARELAEELVRGQVSFMLQPGDYLIV